MGLSSSQARLLSLTSRQHSIEGEAQRIQANKLRLANESDRVYMKYLNALDETSLQTKQTRKSTGADSWVGGSINNLLRYGTSDEYTGNVFYVQDLASGKLYMPEAIFNSYNSVLGSGDEEDIRNFIKSCDSSIEYEEVDNNKYILDDYKRAVVLGYETAASDEILARYNQELLKDEKIEKPLCVLRGALPSMNANGKYLKTSSEDICVLNVTDAINQIKSSDSYNTIYTQQEKDVLESLSLLVAEIDKIVPPESQVIEKSSGVLTIDFHHIKMSAKDGDRAYIQSADFNQFEALASALNGGTVNIEAKYDQIFESNFWMVGDSEEYNIDFKASIDIYNTPITLNGVERTGYDILRSYNSVYSNYGAAINRIIDDKIDNKANNAKKYLESIGKTYQDLENYRAFKTIKEAYDNYTPDIEYVPNDKLKAAYYEQIYNSIKAAGGCIIADAQRCKNEAWVGNMIKSTQVILTAWDEEHEILSKTLPSLNTHIQEVSDSNKIEQAGI